MLAPVGGFLGRLNGYGRAWCGIGGEVGRWDWWMEGVGRVRKDGLARVIREVVE